MAKMEKIQWVLTLGNTLKDLVDFLTKTYEKVPEKWKQRLPGFLGLSLEDERIFNSVLCMLDNDKQIIITKFLGKKCKDYERNRFINIVAGMEVDPGRPEVIERKWNKKEKRFNEIVKERGMPPLDRRQKFLEKFADILITDFKKNLDKAYDYCVGGRMILPDPFHQKILRRWNLSIQWFKKVILDPFSAVSITDLKEKIKSGNWSSKIKGFAKKVDADCNKAAGFINEKTEKAPEYQGFWKEAFWFLKKKERGTERC